MKKFASIFALTLIATSQALKISETVGEQAQMGQKLNAKLGAPTISSITSGFLGANSTAKSVQQSISSSQSAISSAITALSNSQQSINQIVQQINDENISFSTISSQLKNLGNSLASPLDIAQKGNSSLDQASSQASQIQSQVSQLSSDYNNFINGTDLTTLNIVTLNNCWINYGAGTPGVGNYATYSGVKSIYDATTQYKNSGARKGQNIGYWVSSYQQLFVVYDIGTYKGFGCDTLNASPNPNYAVLFPMKGGIITQASNS